MLGEEFDLLIVGAGPVGCVVAERAASQLGWRVLLLDCRRHIAGNCHDHPHENGVLIHRYGPHYFRTNNRKLVEYLSRFTEWIPGNYVVKSCVGGMLYPFPINLTTLELFFGRKFDEISAHDFLLSRRKDLAHPPRNSEEFVLSRVGTELYEAFYKGYTLKQWGKPPCELDPSVCGRIPVRLNREETYVDHSFQYMPDRGFTAMFSMMIEHPRIRVQLGVDYLTNRNAFRPRIATMYCGPVDAYFGYCFGKLPWRSLGFEYKTYQTEFHQPCVQINFPNDHEYTRTVEIKHVTRQVHSETVVTYEYPRSMGEPYYPIPSTEAQALYEKYREAAEQETRCSRVYFSGRLALYRYINTDEAIELALETFDRIRRDAEGVGEGRRAA